MRFYTLLRSRGGMIWERPCQRLPACRSRLHSCSSCSRCRMRPACAPSISASIPQYLESRPDKAAAAIQRCWRAARAREAARPLLAVIRQSLRLRAQRDAAILQAETSRRQTNQRQLNHMQLAEQSSQTCCRRSGCVVA